jgi:hypothetical protein
MSPGFRCRRTGVSPERTVAMVVLECRGRELGRWAARAEGCDLAVVDRIARMALAARRMGCTLRLTAVDDDLRDLLEFAGLFGRQL